MRWLLAVALLLAQSSLATTIVPTGVATPLLENVALAATGSATVTLVPGSEVDLVYNISGSVTGTLPTVVFTVADADPLNPATAITGGQTASSASITSASSGVVTISTTHSTAELVTWTVGGTLPSFGGTYLTLVYKQPVPFAQ